MKKTFVASALLLVSLLLTSNAFAVNVALNAAVSLEGTFFSARPATAWPSGSAGTQGLIDSVVDGVFLPEGTQWDQNTLWWDEGFQDGVVNRVLLDLGAEYFISSFRVQADNNDVYQISYLDSGSAAWVNVGAVAGWGMMTRPELFLPSTIQTSMIAITAVAGDGYYALSEVQAEGSAVPEPATMLLMGAGLAGLAGLKRKKA